MEWVASIVFVHKNLQLKMKKTNGDSHKISSFCSFQFFLRFALDMLLPKIFCFFQHSVQQLDQM